MTAAAACTHFAAAARPTLTSSAAAVAATAHICPLRSFASRSHAPEAQRARTCHRRQVQVRGRVAHTSRVASDRSQCVVAACDKQTRTCKCDCSLRPTWGRLVVVGCDAQNKQRNSLVGGGAHATCCACAAAEFTRPATRLRAPMTQASEPALRTSGESRPLARPPARGVRSGGGRDPARSRSEHSNLIIERTGSRLYGSSSFNTENRCRAHSSL